jgi:hypothetical protein
MFAFFFMLVQWAFIATILEYIFRAIVSLLKGRLSKEDFFKVMWGVMAAVVVLIHSAAGFAQILAMVPVAFVQIHLARGSDGPTTIQQVWKYLEVVWTRLTTKLDGNGNKGGGNST